MNPAQVIADLRAAGRTPQLPVRLEMQAGDVLTLERPLRLVPGKRLVAAGSWNGRPALVKLFLAEAHQRHGERERAGLVALHAAGVRTPALLAAGPVRGGAYAVVCEWLAAAEDLGSLWNAAAHSGAAADIARAASLLTEALPLLAGMHAAGLAQADLHLGNFLLAGGALYAIDGDAVQVKEAAGPLSDAAVIANLAILFAGLTPAWDDRIGEFLAAYQAAPGGRPLDVARVQAAVLTTRARRLHKFLEKTGRDCTQFAVARSWQRVWAVERTQLARLRTFLAAPDRFVEGSHCFKTGGTCTVVAAEIDATPLLIKRYNIKHWRHALSRAWRPSRAWHSWRAAHLLTFYGIATPSPLAVLEERCGPLRGRAFLVTELCPGKNLLDTLQPEQIPEPPLATALLTLFEQLHALRITHGDCKGTNLFWHAGKVFLIDLDALQQHRSDWRFQRLWQRDRARFLRNWPADSVLVRWLDAHLPGKATGG